MAALTYTQALKAVLDRLTALEDLIENLPVQTEGLIEIDTRLQVLQGKLTPKVE